MDYRWRVRSKNIIALEQAVRVPSQILSPRSFHYNRPKFLSESQFNALRRLGTTKIAEPRMSNQERDQDYFEGDGFEAIHKGKERSRQLVKAAKARFIRLHGRLFCEICKFDFATNYGAHGSGFIEAHHITAGCRAVPGSA